MSYWKRLGYEHEKQWIASKGNPEMVECPTCAGTGLLPDTLQPLAAETDVSVDEVREAARKYFKESGWTDWIIEVEQEPHKWQAVAGARQVEEWRAKRIMSIEQEKYDSPLRLRPAIPSEVATWTHRRTTSEGWSCVCGGTGLVCGCERGKVDPHPRDGGHTMSIEHWEGVPCPRCNQGEAE